MKYTLTLFIVSVLLNIGLITGYVKIGSPEKLQETAYFDDQRERLTALMGESQ